MSEVNTALDCIGLSKVKQYFNSMGWKANDVSCSLSLSQTALAPLGVNKCREKSESASDSIGLRWVSLSQTASALGDSNPDEILTLKTAVCLRQHWPSSCKHGLAV